MTEVYILIKGKKSHVTILIPLVVLKTTRHHNVPRRRILGLVEKSVTEGLDFESCPDS